MTSFPNYLSGLLTIWEALDRETRASYVLNISAEDAGVPKMAAYQELRLSVEDVNDNSPLFELSVYQGVVNESSPAGTPVATVRATDNDQGEERLRAGTAGVLCQKRSKRNRPRWLALSHISTGMVFPQT